MASHPASPNLFTVQFDSRIALTEQQIGLIEQAIGAAVAEQLALLSVTAKSEPLPQPESVPTGQERWKYLGRQYLRPDL